MSVYKEAKVLDLVPSKYKIPATKKIESIRKPATPIRNQFTINSLIKKNENLKDTDYKYISIKKLKELFEQKVEFFNQDLITISMEGDDIFRAVVDKLVSLYSQSKESIDANIPKGVDAIKYMVAKRVTKILLGDGFSITSTKIIDNPVNVLSSTQDDVVPDSTEKLKRKYTPEQIVEMRKLRAEVEKMLEEVETIGEANEKAIDAVLAKYRIYKYRGFKVDGDAISFVQNENSCYKKWIDQMVIFKAEIRRIDQKLITRINYEHNKGLGKDPLMTEDKYTELLAEGILGNERQQRIAKALVKGRSTHRELMASIRG